jgi:hypothetical protein
VAAMGWVVRSVSRGGVGEVITGGLPPSPRSSLGVHRVPRGMRQREKGVGHAGNDRWVRGYATMVWVEGMQRQGAMMSSDRDWVAMT